MIAAVNFHGRDHKGEGAAVEADSLNTPTNSEVRIHSSSDRCSISDHIWYT